MPCMQVEELLSMMATAHTCNVQMYFTHVKMWFAKVIVEFKFIYGYKDLFSCECPIFWPLFQIIFSEIRSKAGNWSE